MDIKKIHSLKNKKILITAGPTWVPIDSVRVISNTATGETGILLAERLQSLGASVTLLLGPVVCCSLKVKIKTIRFRFFDELLRIIKRELVTKRYDAVIHSAAVSDYSPAKKYGKKFKSGKPVWKLDLVPTQKIIGLIKKFDSSVFLVGFKFEPEVKKGALINETKKLIERANLDLAVGNTVNAKGYKAFILGKKIMLGAFFKKSKLIRKLSDILEDNL